MVEENAVGGDHTPVGAVRAYYEAIDAGEYDRIRRLLAPEFVQRRPDRTLAGRDAFVGFMRDRRPRTDTTHVIAEYYRRTAVPVTEPTDEDLPTGETPVAADAAADDDPEASGETRIAARGRMLDGDGEPLFGFVDCFTVGSGRLVALRTYTD